MICYLLINQRGNERSNLSECLRENCVVFLLILLLILVTLPPLSPPTRSTTVITVGTGVSRMDHQTSGLHSQSSQSGFRWLSFAYQGLTEIPYDIILPQTDTLQVLDLSYNRLEEYPFSQEQPANSQPEKGWNERFLGMGRTCEPREASRDLLGSTLSFLLSFTRSSLEPGSAGPAAQAQHAGPGREPLHVPHQVPLPAQCDHALHQQEQAQQPARLCGGDPKEGPKPKVRGCSPLCERMHRCSNPHV